MSLVKKNKKTYIIYKNQENKALPLRTYPDKIAKVEFSLIPTFFPEARIKPDMSYAHHVTTEVRKDCIVSYTARLGET
jgi:hypothetical protein